VVEPAEPDVVGPAVAADDPDALVDEVVGEAREVAGGAGQAAVQPGQYRLELLDPGGRAIPGLYGAGRATAGIAVGSYSSGLSLGDGTFFGRRAGRAAAAKRITTKGPARPRR